MIVESNREMLLKQMAQMKPDILKIMIFLAFSPNDARPVQHFLLLISSQEFHHSNVSSVKSLNLADAPSSNP